MWQKSWERFCTARSAAPKGRGHGQARVKQVTVRFMQKSPAHLVEWGFFCGCSHQCDLIDQRHRVVVTYKYKTEWLHIRKTKRGYQISRLFICLKGNIKIYLLPETFTPIVRL